MVSFAKQGDLYLRHIDDRRKKVKQLLWGDFLNIGEETADGSAKVKWGRDRYWVRQDDCQDERPLEVVCVDGGQGHGCLLVTAETGPDEKVVLIDAGARRDMYKFATWRFGKLRKRFPFHAAVVTHSDEDHYGGFRGDALPLRRPAVRGKKRYPKLVHTAVTSGRVGKVDSLRIG